MGSGGSTDTVKETSYHSDQTQFITKHGYEPSITHAVGDHGYLDDDVSSIVEKEVQKTKKTTIVEGSWGQYHLFLEHRDGMGDLMDCQTVSQRKGYLNHAKAKCKDLSKKTSKGDQIYVAEGCYTLDSVPHGIVAHGYKDQNVHVKYRTYWYECGSNGQTWYKDDDRMHQAEAVEIQMWPYTWSAHANQYGDTFNNDYQDVMVYDSYNPYGATQGYFNNNYDAVFLISLISLFILFFILIACIVCIACLVICFVLKKLRDDGNKVDHHDMIDQRIVENI